MTVNEKFNAFIDRLTRDKKLRQNFANDPKGVLAQEGIELPAEMIPPQVDVNVLEERLNALNVLSSQIQKQGGIQVDKLSLLAGNNLQRLKLGGDRRDGEGGVLTII